MARHNKTMSDGSTATNHDAAVPIGVHAAESADAYSRDRYGSGSRAASGSGRHASASVPTGQSIPTGGSLPSSTSIYPEIARVRRRGSLAKRILKVVGCIIALMLIGGAAYAAWFTNALDRALAPEPETEDALAGILVPETSGKAYYVLVMGSDSREGNSSIHHDERGDNERSDVMMLIRVDEKNRTLTMLSIPRDTPYRCDDGSYVKLNELFNAEGIASTVTAVSELTGLPISHHAEVRVSGLANIVDLIGGVTVDVPIDLSYETMDHKEITIKAGRQTLNGEEAEIFSRARHEFEDDQDAHRQNNVRELLQGIIKKILDHPITDIPGLVLQIAEYIDTDYKTISAISLATTFSGGDVTMYSTTGPHAGDFNEATGGKWLCYLNPEGWKAIVDVVDSGQDPEQAEIDYTQTQILWTDVTDQPDFNSSDAHKYYYGV